MNPNIIEKYQANYVSQYGFEETMVFYRRRLLMERLEAVSPQVVVEIGCGTELLYAEWLKHHEPMAQWIIVEPGATFAAAARQANLPGLQVVEGFLQTKVDEIGALLARAPDLVICAGLLQEVPDAAELLAGIRKLMGSSTLLHVNVPNSNSLHRRIAKSMGLIDDVTQLSEQNIRFFQHRVYDAESLSTEIASSGFERCQTGGYFVKPFTHAQMASIAPHLGPEVLNGLFQLGRELPELASEIFAEAYKAGNG